MQTSLSYVTRHEFAGFLGVSTLNYIVQVKLLSKVEHYFMVLPVQIKVLCVS